MAAKNLPYMKFYPRDWLGDPVVRRMSASLRGWWIDLICLMWSMPHRGVLRDASGAPLTKSQIAKMLGCKTKVIDQMVELGALFGAKRSNTYFSKRIVRDELKRRLAASRGKKGASKRYAEPHRVPHGVPHSPDIRYQNKNKNKTTHTTYAPSAETTSECVSPMLDTTSQYRYRVQGESFVTSLPPQFTVARRKIAVEASRVIGLVVERERWEPDEAGQWLIDRHKAYRESPVGMGRFTKATHNWLADGCYDDPESAWSGKLPGDNEADRRQKLMEAFGVEDKA